MKTSMISIDRQSMVWTSDGIDSEALASGCYCPAKHQWPVSSERVPDRACQAAGWAMLVHVGKVARSPNVRRSLA